MNRRGFLGFLVGGVAATAAVRTFPFRVYSFPNTVEPVTARISEYFDYFSQEIYFDKELVANLKATDTFSALASRRSIPMDASINRKFFTYTL